MYLSPTLMVCLLLGQAAGDGSARVAPVPALPKMAPPTVLPEPKMPDLPGTPAPRNDLSPAEPSFIPKTPGEIADRAANPSPPRESHRATPAQEVAALCRPAEDATSVGGRLSLLQAISNARDRNQQAAAIHAYWRLTQAMAEYRISFEAQRRLSQIQARNEAAAMLLSSQAAGMASVQAAKVALLKAQYDLAAAAQLPPTGAPPLAANLPHAGPYRTVFDQIASRPSIPPAAGLLNRTLPDNYQAIQRRLAALHEADNALAAATEVYQAGQGDLPGLLRCHDAFVSQQRIFIADVCDYNHRIADYVLSVLQRPTTIQALVDMLILTGHGSGAPAGEPAKSGRNGTPPGNLGLDAEPNAVRAASGQEPLSGDSPLPRKGPKSILRRPSDDRAAAANPAGRLRDAGPAVGLNVADSPARAPAHRPADDGVAPSLMAQPAGPLVPVPPSAPAALPGTRTAQMQITRTDPKTLELFPGLTERPPASRAQELSAALHATAQASQTGVKAVELRECLRSARPADRREVIAAYWLARQRAAEYKWLLIEQAWLERLDQPARDHRAASSAGPLETVRVLAAREAVNADVLESSIALLEAEFDLTRRCGAPAGSSWFLPVTPPHAGPYDLKKGSLPPQLSQAWDVRRLVDVIPGYLDDLQHRAQAAVQADVARAAFTAAYQDGNASIESILTQIEKETAEVRSFLETATKYNQSIAEYVLRVAPPSIDAETLSRALVIPRTEAPAGKPF